MVFSERAFCDACRFPDHTLWRRNLRVDVNDVYDDGHDRGAERDEVEASIAPHLDRGCGRASQHTFIHFPVRGLDQEAP